jgi:hypothetical protein
VLLLLVALAGAVLLVVADFSTLSYRSIGIGACPSRESPGVCETIAHDQHGYALVIIAPVAALMAFGAAIGRSRAAALAVMVLGLVVLGIGWFGDRPKLDSKRGLEARYTDVKAHTGEAYKLELAGGVLLFLAGGLALLRPPPREPTRRRRPRESAATEPGGDEVADQPGG